GTDRAGRTGARARARPRVGSGGRSRARARTRTGPADADFVGTRARAAVGLRATADSDDQSERKFQRRTQGNAPCVLLSLHRALWVRFLTRHGRNPANDEPREKIP